MLTPKVVSNLIRDTALGIIPVATYLRATDVEANIAVDNIDLKDQVFVLYNNLPEIDHDIPQEGNSVLTTWPVEIRLLCLADMDDDTQDADDIQDPLYGYAKSIWNTISGSFVAAEYSPRYTIGLGESIKIYDKVMTGVMLQFDIIDTEGLNC